MTLSLPVPSFREDAPEFLEKSCPKRPSRRDLTSDEARAEWLKQVMWRAFPEANSESDLAKRVAAHLTRRGQVVAPRTVRYWLRAETAPGFLYVLELQALAGAESVMELIFGTGRRK